MPGRRIRRVGKRVVKSHERGFSLLEVLVASALTIAVILVITGAVLGSLRATALAAEKSVLSEDALNALTDLRDATGYGVGLRAAKNQPLLAKLVGHTATMTRQRSTNVTETITLSIVQAGPASPIVAEATASDGTRSETERRTLFYEAPAPGSVVSEDAP